MFNIIGLMKPLSMIHGVMNRLNPYPHKFLLTVIETKSKPAQGL